MVNFTESANHTVTPCNKMPYHTIMCVNTKLWSHIRVKQCSRNVNLVAPNLRGRYCSMTSTSGKFIQSTFIELYTPWISDQPALLPVSFMRLFNLYTWFILYKFHEVHGQSRSTSLHASYMHIRSGSILSKSELCSIKTDYAFPLY